MPKRRIRRTTSKRQYFFGGFERLEARTLFAADLSHGLASLPALTLSATEYQESRILVRFQDGADQMTALEGTRFGRAVASVANLREIDLEAGISVDEALAAYRGNPHVLYAEPDAKVSVDLVPNDPRFSSLWGLNNTAQSGGIADSDIDAVEAWDNAKNLAAVTVAVIDTGIDFNHPDLKANMWVNTGEVAGNRIDDDRNGYVDDIHGWDFVHRDNSPLDDNGHGTHVAGTIGAVTNNGIGIAGIAPNAKLMALKFLGADGGGYLSDAIAAIDYAARNGAQIANNSWGGGAFSQALSDAIERYRQSGGVFVAAAGNEGANNDVVASYPANFAHNNILSVAASDASDRLASFSNYGVTKVDVAAPGLSILSTTPNNTYSTFSGTSMATPHVSGAAAVLWGQNPTWTYTQVVDRIVKSADSLLKDKVAYGRLNLNSAAVATPSVDTFGPRVTNAAWFGATSTTLNRIRLTFDESVNASTLTAADISLKSPAGSEIPITAVTAVSATEFDVTFASQSSVGSYSLAVGPNVADTKGNLMNQDSDTLMGESLQDQFTATHSLKLTRTFTWTGATRIYDNRLAVVQMDIPTDVTISDLNVRVNISHTYDSDLRIYIADPTGVTRLLFNRRGGSGDNLYATFDDEATIAVRNGRAPFNGSFVPESSLSVYDGKRTAGRWTLYVEDVLSWYTGTINSVSLIVQSSAVASGSASIAGETRVRNADAIAGDGSLHLPSLGRSDSQSTLITSTVPEAATPGEDSSGFLAVDAYFAAASSRPKDTVAMPRQKLTAEPVDEFFSSTAKSEFAALAHLLG